MVFDGCSRCGPPCPSRNGDVGGVRVVTSTSESCTLMFKVKQRRRLCKKNNNNLWTPASLDLQIAPDSLPDILTASYWTSNKHLTPDLIINHIKIIQKKKKKNPSSRCSSDISSLNQNVLINTDLTALWVWSVCASRLFGKDLDAKTIELLIGSLASNRREGTGETAGPGARAATLERRARGRACPVAALLWTTAEWGHVSGSSWVTSLHHQDFMKRADRAAKARQAALNCFIPTNI